MTNNDAQHVVVDGSNIAFEGRESPSLRQLDEAVRAFINEHPHDVLTVVVDATFAHRIDPSEKDEYEAGIENGELVSPPAGAVGRGDAFVLEIAARTNATVLSNDSFQEFHGEHAWLFDDGRLIGGKPIQDVGWVFVARTPVRGPASRRALQDAKKAKRDGGDSGDQGSSSSNGGGNRRRRGGGGNGGQSGNDRSRSGGGGREQNSGRGGRQPAASKATDGGGGRGGGRQSSRRGGGGDADKGRSSQPGSRSAPKRSGSFGKFVDDHPLGSTVTGTVSSFASHGAHLDIDGVRCYLPLAAMADPPPNGARELLNEGEELSLIVDGVNEKFENLDLAIPGFESPEAASARSTGAGAGSGATKKKRRWGRRRG